MLILFCSVLYIYLLMLFLLLVYPVGMAKRLACAYASFKCHRYIKDKVKFKTLYQ